MTDLKIVPKIAPDVASGLGGDSQHDLSHFLKLAVAQVRHRIKTIEAAPSADQQQIQALQLLEDLIKEQGQSNENSRTPAGATR